MTGPFQYRFGVHRLRMIGSRIGYVLGAALILAALIAIWHKHHELADAFEAMRSPDPVMIALLLSGVFINVILTGYFFGVLLKRYGEVSLTEMTAVLAVATLMNFLPMQPGLIARLAYHKKINGIRLRDTVKVQIQAMSISTLTSGGILLLIFLCSRVAIGIVWPTVGVTMATAIAAAAFPAVRHYMAATTIRLLELVTWAARYYAAFSLLGLPISLNGATAMACVSMAVSLVPMFSNGMGIREWSIGAMAPYLSSNHVSQGLAAELVNRAAEIVVITACGLIALAWLTHQHRAFVFSRFRGRETLEELEQAELEDAAAVGDQQA